MFFKEYQEAACSTCTSECYTDEYLDLGYLSEVGELAGKLAKRVRGDIVSDGGIMLEIGDIAWMIAVKARLLGVSLFFNTDIVFGGKCDVYDLIKPKHDEVAFKFAMLYFFCEDNGFDFNECLRMNTEKLSSRKKRGVINGDGDYR